MSKFNNYARLLDKAFKEARAEYEGSANKYLAAVKEHKAANEWFPEKTVGEREARRARAKANLILEKDSFQKESRRIWSDFDRKVSQIKDELTNAVRVNSIASPGDVDAAVLGLLESGALDASDYASLSAKFSDNGTMSKLIGKFANDAAGKAKDRTEQALLMSVSANANNYNSATLHKFDELASVARRCSGRSPREDRTLTDPEYSLKMSRAWEECVNSSLESF